MLHSVSQKDLLHIFQMAYAECPFVEILDGMPKLKHVVASNRCQIGVASSDVRAEFEDVADLNRLVDHEGLPTLNARLTLVNLAQFEPASHVDVLQLVVSHRIDSPPCLKNGTLGGVTT